MKAILFTLIGTASLTSCGGINETFQAMEYNRQAIDNSTQTIEQNICAIEAANRAIEENVRQLEAINASLKKVNESQGG